MVPLQAPLAGRVKRAIVQSSSPSVTSWDLQRLRALLADGTLRIPVQATYELAHAPEALTVLTGPHTQGKLAIQIR